jgi:hypothetical protein
MIKNRLLTFALASAAVLWVACGSSSPSNNFTATLNVASEAPAPKPTTPPNAAGSATLTLNGTTVNYTITYDGLSGKPNVGHIHVGAVGVAGPVVVPFTGLPLTASGTFTGSFTAANIMPQTTPAISTLDDLLAQMRAGNTYANLHTDLNPGGEIRGQIAVR